MRVLITGAGRAIGAAAAAELSAAGHQVIATARDTRLLAGLNVTDSPVLLAVMGPLLLLSPT